jgi:hypothetical protein
VSPLLTWEGPGEVPSFCPQGCGGLTEDPYGGPCKACWGTVGGGKAPRCPLCCEHGKPLTGPCGWRGHDAGIPDDRPMWLCPHGIGVEPGTGNQAIR